MITYSEIANFLPGEEVVSRPFDDDHDTPCNETTEDKNLKTELLQGMGWSAIENLLSLPIDQAIVQNKIIIKVNF